MSQFPEQIYKISTTSASTTWRERHGRYNLVGTRCKDCGALSFPRRNNCSYCHSRNMEEYEMPHTGKVFEISVVENPGGGMMGWGELGVRATVIVELDNGVKVFAEIVDIEDPFSIQQGTRVKMVLRKLRRSSNSDWMYGYKFILDEDDGQEEI